jgi:manganese/iron transport system ATP-binding protein
MNAALDVESLSVRLGGHEVLHDVTLRVRAGELVGLIGPNGAGKTTLLRAVLAVIPRTAGIVSVTGSTGYVPQRHEFAWDFPISVEQAVLTGRTRAIGLLRRAGRGDRRLVAEALERVNLAGLARRPIGELSGGQRQRVLVARALALTPRVLLLDEPFTGLDVPTRDLLTALLRTLRDEGTAVLMTTHDLAAARELGDRLCLLNRTVIADAPPSELDDPQVWLRAFGLTEAAR